MNKKRKSQLVKEIAVYGEAAYRRGFQQAIVFNKYGYGVGENFASELRHKSYNFIYEIYEGNPCSCEMANFYKGHILKRLFIENKGKIISELLRDELK